VAETLDGETTIVDLDSGTYHALNETGSFIWEGLMSGLEPTPVAEALAAAYGIDGAAAETAVGELVTELEGQSLVVPAGGKGGAPAVTSSNGSANGSAAVTRTPYAPPELSTYTDMQELLLLDPIHEVDEAGWPSKP
jgi:hypothetical protein